MKKFTKLLLSLTLCASVVSFTACGGKTLKMATGGAQGTYYAYSGALASMIGENTDLKIKVQTSGGSKANLQLINSGDVDLAIVQNDVAYYAYTGTDLFDENSKITNFRIIASVYSEVCQIVANSSITSIDQLRGKKVSVGDAGSGVEFNAKQILHAYGIEFTDITKQNLSFGDSADALKNNNIDAFFCTAGAPTTAITELATSKTINLLSVDDEHYQVLIDGGYNFYGQYTVPANTYNGVTSDIKMLAIKATLVASDKLSEETVYTLVKTLFEKNSEIGHDKKNELNFDFAFASAESTTGVPYHAGALKYYNEKKGA